MQKNKGHIMNTARGFTLIELLWTALMSLMGLAAAGGRVRNHFEKELIARGWLKSPGRSQFMIQLTE